MCQCYVRGGGNQVGVCVREGGVSVRERGGGGGGSREACVRERGGEGGGGAGIGAFSKLVWLQY